MAKRVNIDLIPTGYTHNVYSGLTMTGTTTLVCSGVTVNCDFEVPSGITEDYIWVKLTCEGCNDQYYKVVMGPPPPIISSLEVCIGNGETEACDCGTVDVVWFTGTTFHAGLVLYTDATLTTYYYNTPKPDFSYDGYYYNMPGGIGTPIEYVSQCPAL